MSSLNAKLNALSRVECTIPVYVARRYCISVGGEFSVPRISDRRGLTKI